VVTLFSVNQELSYISTIRVLCVTLLSDIPGRHTFCVPRF